MFCLEREITRKIIRKIEINGFKFLYELLSLSKGDLTVSEIPLVLRREDLGIQN